MDIYLDYLSPGITTLGPGVRLGLWLQGCARRCPGCLSPDLWQRQERSKTKVSRVLKQVLALAAGHTGLTVSGGEPFDQPEALLSLLSLVREQTSLDIMVYSGYTLSEISTGPPVGREVLSLVDVLIDGRYRRDLPTKKVWRGSDNQQLHLLSIRAQKYQADVEREYGLSRPLQVAVTAGNNLQIIGIPGGGDLERFQENLSCRGITVRQVLEKRLEDE